MEKLKMETTGIVEENIDKIGALFPHCITEVKDCDGKVHKAIDFDKLRAELGDDSVEGQRERYQFTWPQKSIAAALANTPTRMTLRPDRDSSKDFDNTENLYIEGDNLEVLKVLRETYLGQVKMIYIDPPYNTGKDFVYKDRRYLSQKEMDEKEGKFDEYGNLLFTNSDSNGRFHTDWLNFIYPRLKVARDLLTEDGVIFISIDDNELDNLKKICDEIFGGNNFIDIYCWAKTETPENLSTKSRQVIEYVLCYQKSKDNSRFKGLKKFSSSSNGLLNQPNEVGILKFPAGKVKTNIPNGLIPAGMYGTDKYNVELMNDVEVKDGLFVTSFRLKAKFKWSQSYLETEMNSGTIISIPTIKFSPAYDKSDYAPEVPTNFINSKVGVDTNENAGEHQINLFGKKVFSFPKPVSLVKYLLGFSDDPNESYVVMDFFSGSASTAEAVLSLNIGRDRKIKYIMVQLQENLNIALSAAKEQSQKDIVQNSIDLCKELNVDINLCEVAKERIRRAGEKVKNEAGEKGKNLDIGFRVLKLDTSNMKDVFYNPAAVSQLTLDDMMDKVKEDRTDEDLLFQVMLQNNIPLSAKIEKIEVNGHTAYVVDEGVLIATFDRSLDDDTLVELAKMEPLKFVMREPEERDGVNPDNLIDNFEQKFELYSPNTRRNIL